MARKTLPPDVLAYFQQQGRRGGKIGGAKRFEGMSAEDRSELARKAAQARWKKAKSAIGKAGIAGGAARRARSAKKRG